MNPLQGVVNLRLILDAVLTRLWLFPLCAIIAGAVATQGAHLYRPKHVSSAKVLVQENINVNPFLSDMMVDWKLKTRLPVITNVMRSRQTSEQVLRELGLVNSEMTPEQVDQAIDAFQRRLTIFGLGGGIVQIKYQGTGPDEALRGVELIMEIFTAEMLRPQKEALDLSVTFLEGQITRVREELSVLEEKLRVFKEEHSTELPDVYKANLDTYLKVVQDRVETRAELATQRQSLRLTRERLVSYDPVVRGLESQLVRARSDLATLKATLAPEHPRVKAAVAHLRALESRHERARAASKPRAPESLEGLAHVPARVSISSRGEERAGAHDLLTGDLLEYRTAQNSVAALERRLGDMDDQAKDVMQKVRAFARHEKELAALERDIEAKARIYKNLLERHEDALVTRELALRGEASRVWLIEKPIRPSGKNPFKPWMLAIAGAIAGLALAAGIVIALELIDPTLRSEQILARKTEAPMLIRLPVLGVEKKR